MKKSLNKYSPLAMVLVSLPVLIFALWWWGPAFITYAETHLAAYSDQWYAVYMDNGQVLYGQIRSFSSSTIKLTNIYYLQTVKVGDQTTSNLIRRGSQEISAPLNYLLLNRKHVLYWEAVGPNSQVMKVINNGA